MFLPFFPLKLVAFPGEVLNLHIFEPRYRQLLSDMESQGISMGICPYIDQLAGYGTEVRLEKIIKKYPDGRLDIKTVGLKRFKILSFSNPMPDKLYPGGEIEFLENETEVDLQLQQKFIYYLKEVLHHLDFPEEIPIDSSSFSFAHKVGLTLKEELDLLILPTEKARINFLLDHFKKIITVLEATEKAKEKIRQNGHIKHLDPLNF